MSRTLAVCLVAVLTMTTPVPAQGNRSKPLGESNDGKPVSEYTLTNAQGMTVKLTDLGAAITEIRVPDRAGRMDNVVLGFDDADGYRSERNQFFGCTTGRVANRIAGGKFTIDGKEYRVATNNGPNHLHGGTKRSLDKVVWKATDFVNRVSGKDNKILTSSAMFRYQSPDGEEGYPGNLDIKVRFALTDFGELQIEYEAVTDKATPVNLTNHSYFNLAGAGAATVLDHELTLAAERYTPTDKTQIPTGKIESVAGTPFDFTRAKRIGQDIEPLYATEGLGYDHNFVLSKRSSGKAELAAILHDPSTGRVLEVSTDQPGVQIYTGNHLSGQKGREGKTYAKRSAVCLETQNFPNAVNTPGFPNGVLRPSETYRHVCVFAFSVKK